MSYKNYVSATILVNGRPIKEYSHKGLTLIESRHGTNYTVKIKNDNSFKVMAVLSIDGLDVLTGKPAENSKKGYIVDSYSTTEIKGYRINETESASFIFTKKDKAYVTQVTDNARNTGVIGIRIFKEKEKVVEKTVYLKEYVIPTPYPYHYNYPYPYNPWWPTIYYSGATNSGLGAVGGAIANNGGIHGVSIAGGTTGENIGLSGGCYMNTSNNSVQASSVSYDSNTGESKSNCSMLRSDFQNSFDYPQKIEDTFDSGTSWGQKQFDKVKKEYFKAGDILTEIIFYYATKDALISMGVDFDESPKLGEPLPSAFGETNYCKPPTGWRG
jgi:hypothetical protein